MSYQEGLSIVEEPVETDALLTDEAMAEQEPVGYDPLGEHANEADVADEADEAGEADEDDEDDDDDEDGDAPDGDVIEVGGPDELDFEADQDGNEEDEDEEEEDTSLAAEEIIAGVADAESDETPAEPTLEGAFDTKLAAAAPNAPRAFVLSALWREIRESRQRSALAREHAAAERQIALEAAIRLHPGASREEHQAMIAQIRQERANAAEAERAAAEVREQTAAQEARRSADEAEAEHLDAEAARLEQHVKTEVRAAYEAAAAQFMAANEAMQTAMTTRQDELSRAAELRSQADALRAPYREARAQIDTEPLLAVA